MSRRRRSKKKKGMSPMLAVLMLLGSVSYVGSTIWNPFGGDNSQQLASLVGLEVVDPMLDEPQVANQEIVWHDLLVEHGSFDRGTEVRASFSSLLDLSVSAAAPGAEVSLKVHDRWRGQDPPMVRLGVIMVSEKSRRAVFGGRVVGIGDSVANGTVIAIEPGELQLRWGERLLTYDLDDTAPREFRMEILRRKLEEEDKQKELGQVSAAGSQPSPAVEEEK